MLTTEQIQERLGYVGGSEAAAVLGLSRWSTPLKVWGEKTGLLPINEEESLPMEVGNDLEDLVCRLWMKRTGKKLRRVNETQTHKNYPFIRCNIDRRVVGEETIFEAKTASGWKAKEWGGDDIPQEYLIQCQHNMAVTDSRACEIAVLIGGNQSFIYKTVLRDDAMISEIIKREADFWTKFVEPKVPPFVTKDDSDTLAALFPDAETEEPLELTDQANILVEARQGYLADIKNVQGLLDKAENELKALLKTSGVGVTDRYKVTWKNQTRNAFDQNKLAAELPELIAKYRKVTTSRVFRVSKIKEA